MANYKLQYSINCTPIEVTTLEDGTDKIRSIHSGIDKSTGGSKEIDCGSAAGNIKYCTYASTSSAVTIEDAAMFDDETFGTTVDLLYIKIVSAFNKAATAPDLKVQIDGSNNEMYLKGVGDILLVRLGNGSVGIDPENIKVSSTATTGLSNIEMMIGLEA